MWLLNDKDVMIKRAQGACVCVCAHTCECACRQADKGRISQMVQQSCTTLHREIIERFEQRFTGKIVYFWSDIVLDR